VRSFVHSKIPKDRKDAYDVLLGKFIENSNVLTELYKNIVMDWCNEGIKIRKHSSPISIRNISNDIEDKAVQALMNVVRKNSGIFAEYFKIKHKLNSDVGAKYDFSRYHLYAPYDIKISESYDYEKSKTLVFDTFKKFDERFYTAAKDIFDRKHVHSHPKQNKRGGAFCSSVSTDILPYLLLNHTDKLRDVFTMIHELGHGIHYTFSQVQTNFTYHASLPMAETASTFAEMLLADRMLKESKDDKIRQYILIQMLDNQYATIIRQIYFVIFEMYAHENIMKGATKEDLEKYYYSLLKEQFGSMKIPEIFRNEWNYIPHIHESPFYCYAYAWGNLLVLALFDMYKKDSKSFVEKYIKLLSYGGGKSPKDMLSEIGIDPADEKFWQRGFDTIKEEIKELKRLAK
jgi:oligoendopeptidase F